jgi:hypothetical protein
MKQSSASMTGTTTGNVSRTLLACANEAIE